MLELNFALPYKRAIFYIQGVDLVDIMKITGHADYKSMKPCIDIAEDAKTDAMDAMEKALGK